MATEPAAPPREVHRVEVDGVPVFWADGPDPCAGVLAFRVGQADETIPTSGITHLVEHLALWQFGGDQPYEYNGWVELIQTNFMATGTPEQVARFLTATATALAELPLDKLEVERRILETEEASSSGGPPTFHRWARYGATGHGLGHYVELGLRRIGPDDVLRWAREYFTADNAAVWLIGPPSDDLRLPLPRGERRRAPTPRPGPSRLPSFTYGSSGVVSLSYVGERGSELMLASAAAVRRLRQQLRYEEGMTYDVARVVDNLDGRSCIHTVVADCLDENAQAATAALLEIFHDVAERGPTHDELADEVERFRTELADPYSIGGHLDYLVEAELLGRELKREDELLRQDEAVTPETAAAALREALATAILAAPDGVERPPGFHAPGHERPPVEGTAYAEPGPFYRRKGRAKLVVGDRGFTWTRPGDEVTVERDRLAGVLHWPDERLVLIRDCGCEIDVGPELVSRWSDAERDVLARVPRELVVPMRR